MALIWTKASHGYSANGPSAMKLEIHRKGGRFQLVEVDGLEYKKVGPLQSLGDCKESAEKINDAKPFPTVCQCGGLQYEEDADGRCRQCGGVFLQESRTERVQPVEVIDTPEPKLHPVQNMPIPKSTVSNGLASHLAKKSAPKVSTVPHLIIEARAGTGKTTTIIEGLKYVMGVKAGLIPSVQQRAIWEEMARSRGARSVAVVAFNKAIATELQGKVPQGCCAMTNHSMGFNAVKRAFGNSIKSEPYRVSNIISELLEEDIREIRKTRFVLLQATEKLVGLCKMNLVNPCINGTDVAALGEPLDKLWDEALSRLAAYYEVELEDDNGTSYRSEVFDLVPQVIERCLDVKADGCVDFNDMIWLPVALDLPMYRYDLLCVDEAQDLNRCQQALAKKAGHRLILVGDPRQAIYGFAGADAESMPRMQSELGSGQGRCLTLPLTETRRCGRAIVAEANRYVKDFSAHPSNPEGKVSQRTMDDYHAYVQQGDMVLCRVNAPLISQCFRFIKRGRKANIQGRDVAAGLKSTIKKTGAEDVVDLVSKVSDWCYKEMQKEQAKRNPSESKLIAIQDRADCILCFTENCQTVDQVLGRIDSVFTDDRSTPGIRLSSIHKSKGLEADRVFLLQPKGGTVPHPMAKSEWQKGQEINLLYVAITRAIHELVYVYGDDKE